MFNLLAAGIAFCAGMLGPIIGGTQTFITTGFVGIFVFALQVCGADTSFLNDTVLNTLFLPCIIFTGSVSATAYAALHHPIRGIETGRSISYITDPKILLMGGLGGLGGYIFYSLFNYISLPSDTGAVSMILMGIIVRILFNKEQSYNKKGIAFLKKPHMDFWLFQLIMSGAISFITAYIAKETELYTIAFSISAFSLIFALKDSAFPATHHITLVAGYTIMQTGNILLAILLGMISQIIFIAFGMVYNTDCGTHIDPPAVSIALLSFLLFIFF